MAMPTLSVIHGVVMTVLSVAAMPAFLRLFTADETVIRMGVTYSVIAFSFSAVISAELVWEKIFQAVGRMGVAMLALMSGCIFNIIMDPVMIFGLGPFPEMGIAGAALATGLGKGTPSLLVNLCRYTIVIIPSAFLLSRLFGAVGVWHAFWVSEAVTAAISYLLWKTFTAYRTDFLSLC